jgi:hypothetical protein
VATERNHTESSVTPDEIRRRLDDPDVRARAEKLRDAYRRREYPPGHGIGAEELEDFLREHRR